MNIDPASKLDILQNFFQLQQKATGLLLESDSKKNRGELTAAMADYDELVITLRKQLELALHNNSLYPESPFEIPLVVGPLINAMLTLSDVVEATGELKKAEQLREDALSISEEYLVSVDNAERQRQRAASLISQGRFNEALVLYVGAKDRFLAEGDQLNFISVSANIAGIHEWLGDYERALSEVEHASTAIAPLISEGVPSEKDIFKSFFKGRLEESEAKSKILQISLEIDQIVARTNRYLKKYAEARRQFQKILSRVPSDVKPAIQFQLGATLIDEGSYDEGFAALEQLEPLFKGLLRPKLGVLLSYQAEALLGLGNHEQALTKLDAAIKDFSKYHDPDSLWKTEWRRSRSLAALNRPAEALDAYARTNEIIDNLRKAPLGYRLDSTYLKDKLPVFEEAIEMACHTGEARACCRFMEMIKSRILTTALSIPPGERSEIEQELEKRADDLSCQIDALEFKGYQEGWTDEIQQKRETLLVERAEVLERIRFSDSRWRSLSEPIAFDLSATIKTLNERKQSALHLFYRPDFVVAVLIKRGECVASSINISNATREKLRKYIENLQANTPQPKWYDPSTGMELSAVDLIPTNLLASAIKETSLIIIPHGPLHLIPWAGMTFEEKRLIEYCPVGILPNLSCLRALQINFADRPRVALVGAPDYRKIIGLNPLYYAEEELKTIEDIYSHKDGVINSVLEGKRANEENYWKLARHPDSAGNILHIACHGSFVKGDPMNSGLLMSDSRIDASEIARSPIKYDEIILSACSTGYRPTEVGGVLLSGDDILGLPGAFLEAGARSVLVSIPYARDDAALQFMTIYHENREEGKTPLIALQETQKTMLSDAHYPPYLWIGFTIYGCQ